MTTPVEFLAPRWLPPVDWIARLDTGLQPRDDVVAAWFVTTRYPADDSSSEALQEELHHELAEPPGEDGASRLFFREFSRVVPAWRYGIDEPRLQIVWTFPTRSLLPRVRDAGACLWSREAKS